MKRLLLIMVLISTSLSVFGQEVNSFKTSDGETLFYTKTGTGPTIVLLYGGPGYPASGMQPWADSLSNKFECILFEQRGTGLSANVKMDSTTINLKRAVDDIDDLRKHLGKKMLTVCGLSWGGALAQAYAAYYPENVNKLVLVSTLGPDFSLMPAFFDNILMRRYPNESDSLQYWNQQPDSEEAVMKRKVYWYLPYFYDHDIGLKLLPQIMSSVTSNDQMSSLMWSDLVKNYDLKTRLTQYKGECFMIIPRQDVLSMDNQYKIKEILPQSKMIMIEKCGHFADWEKPNELYKIIRTVLK